MKRAAFFVDGFNFYHAVAQGRDNHRKWMSYRKLASLLLRRHDSLEFVMIFSALASHIPASMARHRIMEKAWRADGCGCVMGQFKRKEVRCKACHQTYEAYEEKESDVNIAIHLLNEARKGTFDVAYVLCNDSDMTPAFKMLKAEFPHLELIAVVPPGKKGSNALRFNCDRMISVDWVHVESSLFGAEVLNPDGTVAVTRPVEYDPPSPNATFRRQISN